MLAPMLRKITLLFYLAVTPPCFLSLRFAKYQLIWFTLGWGCKTSSLQTNCFVIDGIETQLIRHIDFFHAIKENRTNLK